MRSWTEHLNAAEAKKYIADNNIQLYTINAIDKAIEIGMGKRTNTILQSAFFKLADVMPIDDAVNFMKQAAQKSYGKKGQDVVEMNWKAIDAGVDAIHKVDVPASWSNPEAESGYRVAPAGTDTRSGLLAFDVRDGLRLYGQTGLSESDQTRQNTL
ncbi:pyruvate ferredoxin/flavodoxin oxidoreductase [human gut metagenome]|uniref:Pyruvate ferredoxin/flavodoxin oxidoreductase n=1 Tax=human gut metagenome TaxID=408170 RepID=K1V2K2_9ZZZZ